MLEGLSRSVSWSGSSAEVLGDTEKFGAVRCTRSTSKKLQKTKRKILTKRCIGQQRLTSCNCSFKDIIERISSISDSGTAIQVSKISSDDVEVTIDQDDNSCVVENTKSGWHGVV